MYKYAAADSIFDGISNIYLVSIATAFLAVIVALYCSNFLKDESAKQLREELNETVEEFGDEERDCLNDTLTEIENPYISDYEYNDSHKNIHPQRNFSTINSDEEFDSDEIQNDGLVSRLKSKRVRKLEAQLTRDQLEEEKRIEREQLAAIFELLKKQEAELNMKEIDESELNAQLSLYR